MTVDRSGSGSVVAGVDLGNANCRLAFWTSPNEDIAWMDHGGRPSFPAVVGYDHENDGWLMGAAATELAYRDSVTVFGDLKTNVLRQSRGQDYADLVSELLRKLKFAFESDSGSRIVDAVLAVPYSCTVEQREALERAAENAFLPVAGLVNEPVATVLGYHVDRLMRGASETVLVFDAGGSQTTVSVVEVGKTGTRVRIDLLSEARALDSGGPPTDGRDRDTDYCGRLLDERIFAACCSGKFEATSGEAFLLTSQHGSGPEEEEQRRFEENRLRHALVEARHQLSSADEVEVPVPGSEGVSLRLTRSQIDQLANPGHTVAVALREALNDAGLEVKEVDRVLLAGGLSQAPYIRQLTNHFGPRVEAAEPGFEEVCTAVGAARCAALLTGRTDEIFFAPKRTPAFGIRMNDGTFDKIIPENVQPEYSRRRIYSLANRFAREAAFDIVQGFSRKCSENMVLDTLRLDLALPEGKQAKDRVERELHVRMTLTEQRVLDVQVSDQTEGLEGASRALVGTQVKPR